MILINAIQCLRCNELIRSTDVHDFRKCSCGAVAVDGGTEYLKRLGYEKDYVEACAYDMTKSTKPNELLGKYIVFCPTGKSNPRLAFDRLSDVNEAARTMSVKFGIKTFYVAVLSSANL